MESASNLMACYDNEFGNMLIRHLEIYLTKVLLQGHKMKFASLILGCLLMAGCATRQGAQAAGVDCQNVPGQSATVSREQWAKLTAGTDLAHGKKVFFSPAPNYRLTTDANDPYDLTDGTLTSREDDRVWFN